MGVYKTTFCKIGYNSEITTSTDPEDVCTGLGLNGNNIYGFPVKLPPTLVAGSVYTRTYFISSSSTSDTGYHDYDEVILIDENMHGSVGAIEVKISGLNTNFGLTEEVIRLNGQTPVQLANHYHRINEMKVVTAGRLLSNQGDIYLSALDGARTAYLLKLEDFVSSGVPIANQHIYAKILGGDNRMLSSHYTVPRSHTLYIESIHIFIDSTTQCDWILKAGVNGALHVILKSRNDKASLSGSEAILFNRPYVFPAGSDIKVTINTVGATTDATSILEGYLVSRVKLDYENIDRKGLDDQIISNPDLEHTKASVSREEELIKETFKEDTYTDEEFSDVPDYTDVRDEDAYNTYTSADLPPDDSAAYDETCEPGYTWCESSGDCVSSDIDCWAP